LAGRVSPGLACIADCRRLRRIAAGNIAGWPRRPWIAEHIAELRRGRPCDKAGADHKQNCGAADHETLGSFARPGGRLSRRVNILNAAKPGIGLEARPDY
jgi:hypothetical protein